MRQISGKPQALVRSNRWSLSMNRSAFISRSFPAGHGLLLRFHANDLGNAAFDREPLALTSGGLVLKRYGTEIRFMRVRP